MRLEPWMLHADWRADRRAWLWIDLAAWPVDCAIEPLPPVPVIALGSSTHLQAVLADVVLEPGFTLAALAAPIERNPLTAAALVHLLRATGGIAVQAALMAESFAFATLQGGAEHRAWIADQSHDSAKPGTVRIAREGATLHLTLDRPHAHNAIDRAIRDALFDGFALANADDSVREIRLNATGRAFSTGADLAEFGTTRDPPAAHLIRARTLPAWPLLRRHGRFTVEVNGACVGSGLELAAFADRLVATRRAWFQLPELAMGVIPGFGGTVSLPRRIGRQRAALLMLSGRRIPAATALRWGLVDALVDDLSGDDGRADEPGG